MNCEAGMIADLFIWALSSAPLWLLVLQLKVLKRKPCVLHFPCSHNMIIALPFLPLLLTELPFSVTFM